MENNEIKSLTPVVCPHCQKTLMVELTTNAPSISGIYTPEMIEGAKKDALERIKLLLIPDEVTKPIVDWINDPNTIFGPNDVDEIVNNIQKQNNEPEEA